MIEDSDSNNKEESIVYAKNNSDNIIEHSEIAEISDELNDSNEQNTKDDFGENPESDPDSSDDEMDSKEENQYKINTNTVNQPTNHLANNAQNDVNCIHPFMLEGVQEEKRRKSWAVFDLGMIVNYQAKKEEEVASIHEFDENYLMFGGDKYLKVSK